MLDWGEWGECSNGQRQRVQVVTQNKVGAGKDCPEPIPEVEGNFAFFKVKDFNNQGLTFIYLSHFLIISHFAECLDCQVEWADWSECLDGVRLRLQYVSRDKVGAGSSCPELETQSEGKLWVLVRFPCQI